MQNRICHKSTDHTILLNYTVQVHNLSIGLFWTEMPLHCTPRQYLSPLRQCLQGPMKEKGSGKQSPLLSFVVPSPTCLQAVPSVTKDRHDLSNFALYETSKQVGNKQICLTIKIKNAYHLWNTKNHHIGILCKTNLEKKKTVNIPVIFPLPLYFLNL